MIIQPVRIMEFPDEELGQTVATSWYRLPINQVYTVRHFQVGKLQPERTSQIDTNGETVPAWFTHTSKVQDGVPVIQVIVSDSAPSAANAKFFIPPVK